MIKQISYFIDKILWPQRIKKVQRCDRGWWWWIKPAVDAITAVAGGGSAASGGAAAGGYAATAGGMAGSAGAIGSGTAAGSAAASAGAIGAGAGGGLLTAAGEVGMASGGAQGLQSSGLGNLLGGGKGVGAGLSAENAQLGESLPLASQSVQTGLQKGLMDGIMSGAEDIGKIAINEMTPFGDLFDPNQKLPEKLGNTAVKIAKEQKDKKAEPLPAVNIDNSTSMQSPKTVDIGTTTKRGIQGSLPPEVMMKIVQMMQREKAQGGGTRPLASAKKFPGRYY
jgi:hypothetical protein